MNEVSKENKYPLDEQQEALLLNFICHEVNRGYKAGFIHGFAAALTAAIVYYFFI